MVRNLAGDLLGEVSDIRRFKLEAQHETPVKTSFVVQGPDRLWVIKHQNQLDALPPGRYDANVAYSLPTERELKIHERKKSMHALARSGRP